MPDRSLVRLRQRASELLKAEVEYAATVIRAFVHPLDNADDMLSWVWLRTTRARSAFEASSGSVRADAPEVRKWLTSYRAALNAVTGACVTLEEQVAKAERETLDPQFVVAVEDYVDALRGDTPSRGRPGTSTRATSRRPISNSVTRPPCSASTTPRRGCWSPRRKPSPGVCSPWRA